MSIKKRIVLVLILIAFIILLMIFSNIFEKHIIERGYTKLNNIYTPFIKTSNFKLRNKDRYISYYEKNNTLSYETVVTYVNIGLDKGFYNYISNANLDMNYNVLVNKFNKLDNNYVPNDLETINSDNFINGNHNVDKLRSEARIAFENMSNDSIRNGTPVYGQSAFRSYEVQSNIYDNSLKRYGLSKTDKESARPGFSEHQTGLAIDVSSTKSGNMLSFENTKSFIWMINNSYKYGFILRYPKDKETIHGYIYEPWHYRYVGKTVAKDIKENHCNLTYDEYYYKFLEEKKG